jgi:hypothetical protein
LYIIEPKRAISVNEFSEIALFYKRLIIQHLFHDAHLSRRAEFPCLQSVVVDSTGDLLTEAIPAIPISSSVFGDINPRALIVQVQSVHKLSFEVVDAYSSIVNSG